MGKQLTADKLKTNLVGGGTCLWVPEDETMLGTKYISENGTYKASDDGYYGYSEVSVSGIGTVTGKDPETGEEVQVGVDPETGDIVETVLATEIRITTPPTKTSYVDGETIDYSGIVVHAYSSTGNDLGAVPFEELVFPVSTAKADGDMWTDGQGLNAMHISYMPTWTIYNKGTPQEHEEQYYVSTALGMDVNGRPTALGSLSSPGQMLITRYNDENYAMSTVGTRDTLKFTQMETTQIYGWYHTGTGGGAGNGVFKVFGLSQYIYNIPLSSVDPTTADPTALHAVQSLPVQWPRTGDGAVLETSFDIQVIPTGGDAA